MRRSSSLVKCYSVEFRDKIFVKSYWFLFFTKNLGKNVSGKYSATRASKVAQKCFDSVKNAGTTKVATNAL